ncbi:hypothetical protein MMC16_006621 [Acarospora aff. strigata]|nr:hypothetical protein [Acarospora aff. strigata]
MEQQVKTRRFLEIFKNKPRTDKDDLQQYYRDFMAILATLVEQGVLDLYTQGLWFLQGLPKSTEYFCNKTMQLIHGGLDDKLSSLVDLYSTKPDVSSIKPQAMYVSRATQTVVREPAVNTEGVINKVTNSDVRAIAGRRQFVYFYSTVSETEETGTEGRSCLQEKVEEDPSSTSSQTDDSIPAGLVHWKKEAMKEEIDMATLDTGPCKHWLTPKFSELVRGSRLIPECAERMLVGSWRTVVEGEEFASSRSAIERVAAQSRQERDRLAEARHRIIKN